MLFLHVHFVQDLFFKAPLVAGDDLRPDNILHGSIDVFKGEAKPLLLGSLGNDSLTLQNDCCPLS